MSHAVAMQRTAGLRESRPSLAMKAPSTTSRRAQRAVVTPRAEAFFGSPTNLIVVASTTAFLVAGRFGLAPTANAQATPGLKLEQTNRSGQFTGDPAGFTFVDVLGLGTLGHVAGVGIVLGLKTIGALSW